MSETKEQGRIKLKSKVYYGWIIVLLTFATLLVSAGIRSLPSVLLVPFEHEFGWSRGSISSVISVGIFLYGLVGPFSAALLLKFGFRKVIVCSLAVLGLSLAVTPFIRSLWQFELLWGLVSGLATGMMANVLGVTVSNQWFVKRKGLVVGLLTASAATGQLLFLPLFAKLTSDFGWRYAVYTAVASIVIVLAAVAVWMRNHPYDVGAAPYGSSELVKPAPFTGIFSRAAAKFTVGHGERDVLAACRHVLFCGLSTNGLIGTHLIAACGDHGILEVAAAGLLAMMGVFDLFGTTISGWLSDRFDSRKLLFCYYGLRGLSLLFLPFALNSASPYMLVVFSVFYGLDWIATVPPTVKLAGEAFGKEKSGMIFGWVVVAHQLGASAAAFGAGALRDWLGSYSQAFVIAGFLCFVASVMAVQIRKSKRGGARAAV
ncbi:MFS transporter [Paenibacillus macerans]|nr:MFS transporter [Paenibacillus macerans]